MSPKSSPSTEALHEEEISTEEEIDVTEIVERLEKLEKLASGHAAGSADRCGAIEARLTECESAVTELIEHANTSGDVSEGDDE